MTPGHTYGAGPMTDLAFTELLPLGPDDTPYRLLTTDGVSTVEAAGRTFLEVEPEALTLLTRTAFRDIAHWLRPAHLAQLRRILDDPEASANDRFVALDLLKNANIAAGGVLPMCQDTGTAIVMGKRGELVLTGGDDERAISLGIQQTYETSALRFSQMAPLTMWDEQNTGTNLPAQIELYAAPGDAYKLLFMAKGGGSANKSYLYQETKAVLNRASMLRFLDEKLRTLGTSACPPYHLAVVIGGTSAEFALKTAKYASAHYLDTLPTTGSAQRARLPRPRARADILALTQGFGIGAQFGGKYFCHDVRVVRLPRHGASCPVAVAVSCSADRQALGKITADGVFLEQLEEDPARYLPEVTHDDLADDDVVRIDLNRPMDEIRAELSPLPGEDAPVAHRSDGRRARHRPRQDQGAPRRRRADARSTCATTACTTPARPRRPRATPSGSFGPTTAGRMDSYVEEFQAAGGSFVMLAKGNRSQQVTDACAAHGGFYLGSIGGPPPAWPRTASARSRCSSTPSSAWRPCGRSRWRTSPPSSWSTTRATTSSIW